MIFGMAAKYDKAASMTPFQSFQTTCWSVIFAARDGKAVEAKEAFATLCGAYWYPLYAFVRRKGYDAETAQDLVQGFLARLLEKRDLVSVDRGKGRFRSFLMAACTHYLANQRDHDRAKKRGGGQGAISIDRLSAEGRYGREPAHELTAERLFEKQWALTLLDRVIERLEQEMVQAGKARQFTALKPALLGGAERTPFARIGTELGLSEDAARAAAHRMRKRYRDLLRDEVTRTLDEPALVEEEIAALFAALAD
jgi:DNA-directed RNA polymerase specialized sigma24 family protein